MVDRVRHVPFLCLLHFDVSASWLLYGLWDPWLAEQQERERAAQQQQPSASPRAGTPVGALMGVVPPPTPMGMLNQQLTPVAGKNRS